MSVIDAPKELAAWRKAQRKSLIDQRMALDKVTLDRLQRAMDRNFQKWFPRLANGKPVLGICWPHLNEYDSRPLAAQWRAQGATIALPVLLAPASPLIFRPWDADTALAKGPLGILYPAAGPEVIPRIVLLPVVGFDTQGYRLGYGGGYFDRTLAAMARRPLVIGTAYEMAKMNTLHPQPYDIPMDYVLTEERVYCRTGGRLISAGFPVLAP